MFAKVLIFALLGVSLVLAQPLSEKAQEKSFLGKFDEFIQQGFGAIQGYYNAVKTDVEKFENEFKFITGELDGVSKSKYDEFTKKYYEYKQMFEHALKDKISGYNDKLEELKKVGLEAVGVSEAKFGEFRDKFTEAVKEEQVKFETNFNEFKEKFTSVIVEARHNYFQNKSFEAIVQDLKEQLGKYVEVGKETLAQYKEKFNQLKEDAKATFGKLQEKIEELQHSLPEKYQEFKQKYDKIIAEQKAKFVGKFNAIVQAIKDKLNPAKAIEHHE